MEVYDIYGNPLDEYDIDLGELKEDKRIIHHPAIEGVEEQGRYELLQEYPNGGRDVHWIVDVPGVKAEEAWDEEIPIQVFVPYSDEEIARIEEERNQPSTLERLIEALVGAGRLTKEEAEEITNSNKN